MAVLLTGITQDASDIALEGGMTSFVKHGFLSYILQETCTGEALNKIEFSTPLEKDYDDKVACLL